MKNIKTLLKTLPRLDSKFVVSDNLNNTNFEISRIPLIKNVQ